MAKQKKRKSNSKGDVLGAATGGVFSGDEGMSTLFTLVGVTFSLLIAHKLIKGIGS